MCFHGLYGNVAGDSGAGRGPGSALPHSEWSQGAAYLEGKHSYSLRTIFFSFLCNLKNGIGIAWASSQQALYKTIK